MSFSSEAKTELLRVKARHEECLIAFMTGVAQACGTLVIKRDGLSFVYRVESGGVARHIYAAAKELQGVDIGLKVREKKRLQSTRQYEVIIEGKTRVKQHLGQLGFYSNGWIFSRSDGFARICCKRSFLRGVFLCPRSHS